jgi:hypothetical protein
LEHYSEILIRKRDEDFEMFNACQYISDRKRSWFQEMGKRRHHGNLHDSRRKENAEFSIFKREV